MFPGPETSGRHRPEPGATLGGQQGPWPRAVSLPLPVLGSRGFAAHVSGTRQSRLPAPSTLRTGLCPPDSSGLTFEVHPHGHEGLVEDSLLGPGAPEPLTRSLFRNKADPLCVYLLYTVN